MNGSELHQSIPIQLDLVGGVLELIGLFQSPATALAFAMAPPSITLRSTSGGLQGPQRASPALGFPRVWWPCHRRALR